MTKKFNTNIKIIAFTFLGVLAISTYGRAIEAKVQNKSVSGQVYNNNIIRLHILANSDSQEDQDLKIKVRDELLLYMKQNIDQNADIEQVRAELQEKSEDIRAAALKVIQDNGKDYDVSITQGMYPFPEKQYGDIILPAGNYDAFRVLIGSGLGHNWWCVLFPPLCFVDATHSDITSSSEQNLIDRLDEGQYSISPDPSDKIVDAGAAGSASDSEDLKIKPKLKAGEIIKSLEKLWK